MEGDAAGHVPTSGGTHRRCSGLLSLPCGGPVLILGGFCLCSPKCLSAQHPPPGDAWIMLGVPAWRRGGSPELPQGRKEREACVLTAQHRPGFTCMVSFDPHTAHVRLAPPVSGRGPERRSHVQGHRATASPPQASPLVLCPAPVEPSAQWFWGVSPSQPHLHTHPVPHRSLTFP